MIRALKENWALFTGMLLLMASNGLLVTLLSVRSSAIGLSETAIGLMQAAYPLGALVGSLYAPRLVERVGHVRAFGALASLCSISAIVHLMTSDFWSWTAMRLLSGLCFPGLYVIAESWLNAKAENRSRALTLSVYFVIQTLGASIGQWMAGFESMSGSLLFGLASILISLSLVPLLVSTSPAPAYSAPDRLSARKFFKISPTAMLGAFFNGILQAAIYVAVPLYGLAVGLGTSDAAGLLVAGTLAGAAAQFPVGWLSDRTDRRLVIALLSLANLALCLALFSGAFDTTLLPAFALVGALSLPVYSLCVAYANDHLAPNQIVPASGTLVLTLNVGVLFGAFAGPAAIGLAGAAGLPLFMAAVSGFTACVALLRQLRSEAPEHSGPVAPVSVQGVQSVGTLHPDAAASDKAD
ncbi:MFS transporter [Roseibium sediminicola]|uniref:MFS transporter n=1 Tax=Roseibium sediminicola TaxID=2933272 RepID=A0ABT0H140_9HYPH|nr:MFS transporter [Roseibium sp. CAU 1639]MCK7615389.1 MFS transporter [Roseibium sp. CAU 1639]